MGTPSVSVSASTSIADGGGIVGNDKTKWRDNWCVKKKTFKGDKFSAVCFTDPVWSNVQIKACVRCAGLLRRDHRG